MRIYPADNLPWKYHNLYKGANRPKDWKRERLKDAPITVHHLQSSVLLAASPCIIVWQFTPIYWRIFSCQNTWFSAYWRKFIMHKIWFVNIGVNYADICQFLKNAIWLNESSQFSAVAQSRRSTLQAWL